MAVSNLSAFTCGGPALYAQLNGPTTLAWVSLNVLFVTALLVGMHRVLARWSTIYRALPPEQQVPTAYHCSYALAYLATVVPMTLYTCRVLFPPAGTTLESAASMQGDILAVFILLYTNAALYTTETGARALCKPNLLLVFHHTVYHAFFIMGYLLASVLTLKAGLIFTTFAMYEQPLFATLAARKLGAPRRAVVGLWWTGMIVYSATRVLQLVVFVPLFVGSYGDMAGCGRTGEWWGVMILVAVMQPVQLATFPIYLGVLRRTAKATARTLSRLGSSLRRGGAPDPPAAPQASGELKKVSSSELEGGTEAGPPQAAAEEP